MVPTLGSAIVSAAPVATYYSIPSSTEPYSSGPLDIVTGPDGNTWFTESYSNKIGRITPSGAITEFPISTSAFRIVVGPDNAMWFTESTSIGRITAGGTVTEFGINAEPTAIASDPDGALWFTDTTNSQIGRMTTSGSVTTYPLPTQAGYMHSITTGPDGALWFTSIYDWSVIGRITTSGVISYFPLPDNYYPTDIITAPDGALWFAQTSDDPTGERPSRIGRITTSGIMTYHDIPEHEPNIVQLTNGPDGAIWCVAYEAYNGDHLQFADRITMDGTVTRCPISSPPPHFSDAWGITNGANGNLWYTMPQDNMIGHIAIGTQAPIVHITNPSTHSTESGTVTLSGVINASSAYNLMLYLFNASGQAVISRYQYTIPPSTSLSTYTWDTTELPNGDYSIVLSAKDSQGNKDANSTSKVKFTVQN